MMSSLQQQCHNTLNRLCKWRSVFAGWQLGTRKKDDPECDAVRDHREVTIVMRVELSALTSLLVEKGLFTTEEFQQVIINEATLLSLDYEERFPGMRASDIGIEYDKRAIETMKNWRP